MLYFHEPATSLELLIILPISVPYLLNSFLGASWGTFFVYFFGSNIPIFNSTPLGVPHRFRLVLFFGCVCGGWGGVVVTQVRRAEARRAGAEEAAREAEAKAYSLSATVQVSLVVLLEYNLDDRFENLFVALSVRWTVVVYIGQYPHVSYLCAFVYKILYKSRANVPLEGQKFVFVRVLFIPAARALDVESAVVHL